MRNKGNRDKKLFVRSIHSTQPALHPIESPARYPITRPFPAVENRPSRLQRGKVKSCTSRIGLIKKVNLPVEWQK